MSARTRALDPVVVVGGGVAGLAAAWSLAQQGERVLLFERAPRLGGLVESERVGEALLEHGADGLLADKPGGHDVLASLGLTEHIVHGGPAPRRAFVTDRDALVEMPGGLFAFERRALFTMLSSPLLSPRAKAALLLEPLQRRRDGDDETVASFFARRLGPEVAEKLVSPMVQGIFGASGDTLGVRSVFPKLASMEDRFGSLGIALLFAARAPKGHGLVSLRDGMESLPRTLASEARAHGARLVTGRGARRLTSDGSVILDDGAEVRARHVIVATDVGRAARLVGDVCASAAESLASIDASDAEVVSFVVPRRALSHALDGTGFVVRADATRRTLACTFASEKWHGRAPRETVTLRSVLRGSPDLDDEAVVSVARDELRDWIGLEGPVTARLRRRTRALPVYAVGHAQRVARTEAALLDAPISLAGNHLRGVGVPDCIASGLAAAARTRARGRIAEHAR